MSTNRLTSLALLLLTLAAACGDGSTTDKRKGDPSLVDGGAGSMRDGGPLLQDGSTTPVDASSSIPSGVLRIEPEDPVVNAVDGKAATIDFTATIEGKEVAAVWSISRAEIGTIDASTGAFKSGSIGGTAEIVADIGSKKVSTTVTVIVLRTQNGAKAGTECAAGGCGGVGGEGAGGAVSSADMKALDAKGTADPAFVWLYPYDGTVWPLDLLAPLLQWRFGATVATAIKLELKSANYSYTGYFARPTALTAGSPFVRHPIPQGVWNAATRSSAGSTINVKLTALVGGKAVGPIRQTWLVASGALKGTVYYQSYGTTLAKNYDGAKGGDGRFGGATLAITAGATAPTLVAGGNGGESQCRVCHTVSADGSRMIVQHGENYQASSSYALTQPAYPETPYTTNGLMGWAALSPDGSVAVTNGPALSGGANSMNTMLVNADTGAIIPAPSLTNLVTQATMPTFSPDGKRVAFTFFEGAGNSAIGTGNEAKLVVMDFDHGTNTFSNAQLVYEGTGGNRPGWPAFMPDSNALVFQVDLPSGANRDEYFATRYGAHGELWYVDLATKKSLALERANGTDKGVPYLPTAPNNHQLDHKLAYEPTVNPIVSGGYAWVVFTSRRLYGNVATIEPDWSDPRAYDLTVTPTPKKLWVAAIDLPPSGEITADDLTDPSHPAFYLPGQELLAGNSRGYWVPEPCRADGKACETGDQCCAGFCAYDAAKDKNLCGGEPPSCAAEFDRCKTAADCCPGADGTILQCINRICSAPAPE